MSVVAVTGARGFIGSHVVADLEDAGHAVRRLGRTGPDQQLVALDEEGHRGSTDLDELLEGVDALVHLAGRLVDSPSTPLEAYLAPNVGLTDRMLRAASSVGVRRFVLASSRLVYPADLGRPARESDAMRPASSYGLSKAFAEQTVTSYVDQGRISAVALRISQAIGEGDGGRGVLARFIEAARAGGPITVTGEGTAVRDFVDVRDVAVAVRLAVENQTTAPALNVGGGGSSITELAEATARAAGLPLDAVRHVPTDDEDRSHWSLDASLAAEQLGWAPRLGLEKTLRDRLASGPG
jgi:UDP-glucose 4-epimerase